MTDPAIDFLASDADRYTYVTNQWAALIVDRDDNGGTYQADLAGFVAAVRSAIVGYDSDEVGTRATDLAAELTTQRAALIAERDGGTPAEEFDGVPYDYDSQLAGIDKLIAAYTELASDPTVIP